VAEADLRVEISKQYPDLELAPGYSWDQGLQRWIAALAFSNLLTNRNKGPIGEAIARRNQMASNVEAVQQRVLGQVEAGVAQCRAASQQVLAAAQLVQALQARERSARGAFERGETTQLEGMGLALSVASAVASLQDARLQDAVVGSELERVTGLWSTEGAPGLPDPLLLPSATFVVQEAQR
jgi:outer membrane protein TolC